MLIDKEEFDNGQTPESARIKYITEDVFNEHESKNRIAFVIILILLLLLLGSVICNIYTCIRYRCRCNCKCCTSEMGVSTLEKNDTSNWFWGLGGLWGPKDNSNGSDDFNSSSDISKGKSSNFVSANDNFGANDENGSDITDKNTNDSNGGLYNNDSIEEILDKLSANIKGGLISYKVNGAPSKQEDGKYNLLIESPEGNKNLLNVKIYLDEGNELIYQTDRLLVPNSHIESAYLMRELSAGKHEATVVIEAYDKESRNYKGQTRVGIVIHS